MSKGMTECPGGLGQWKLCKEFFQGDLRRRLAEAEAREEELKNRLASAHIIQDQGRDRAVANLKARVADLEAEKARLRDDALAKRIGTDCHDPAHDERWCSTCDNRLNGIEAYRDAVLADAAEDVKEREEPDA